MKKIINLKNLITNWFKTDRNFETGKQLYLKYGINLSFKNILNRAGNTPDNFKFLCYELSKIGGIAEQAYKAMLKVPLKPEITEDEIVEKNINDMPINELSNQIEVVDISELNWKNIQKLVKALGTKPGGRKKDDLIQSLVKFRMEKIRTIVPDKVKRSIRLREEFPFLKKKECPGVLKELVADMLTAYENYNKGHQKLVEGATDDEIEALSKDVVEDYLENRQIWDELNHYKTTGEFLGEHPIFEWTKRLTEIRKMKQPDLVKLRDQLNNKIPRTKKKITDEPDHKETAKREERVAQFERELAEVKTLLGIEE